MRRRQVLFGTTALLAVFAGCSGSAENGTEPPTETPSPTPVSTPTETATPTETPTPHPETPPADFDPEWLFDEDDDWTEQRRWTETPDTSRGDDWPPAYGRAVEYAHAPSREAFASAANVDDPPALCGAVLSKWALRGDFSDGIVKRFSRWFETRFEGCAVSIEAPSVVHPYTTELDSGTVVGRHPYRAEGDTGRLDTPLRASVDGRSVDVQRITYEAEGVLFGHVGPAGRVGYVVGGGWPTDDAVMLHTREGPGVEVTPEVNGEAWGVTDALVAVLDDVEQNGDHARR